MATALLVAGPSLTYLGRLCLHSPACTQALFKVCQYNGSIQLPLCPAYTPPLAYKPPLRFQPKFLHRYFYLAYRPPNHGHSTKMIFVETPTLSSSRFPWQRKNGASVHRTAKEFTIDSLACPRVVSISNSTSKGQTSGMLGKRRCLRCGQPLSVNLDHRVSEL